ncbi:aldehyde ferredoxin oxidoreductase [Candidatus Bathyarchaeota archaeon B24-2]|nr:MAG: aldehyde ferredoxin oxidoreductase [Candidatus Bathyarchaeota archaeon B24-2]
MVKGYAGKFLEVDLSSGALKDIKISEETLRKCIGGRALAAEILWDRLGDRWEEVDPLGEENIFLALTGPLTGYFPGMRVCVSAKSPLTNGMVGSTAAGEFPLELKCAGYDGVIVLGRAEKPVYLYIDDSGAEIRDATHVWGKEGKETVRIITKEVIEGLEKKRPKERMWREPAMLYIGPAGEKATRIAAVIQKWTHACGYGGYGGVMGSKNLKAIVVKGTGPLPEVHDIDKVREIIDKVTASCLENEMMRRWGTGYGGYEVGADTSSEPVRNWQEEWHDERSFGVDRFERRVWIKRYWGDYGCPTTCLKVAAILDGPFKGAITDNPDYEIQAYMGTNLGIFEPEANVYVAARSEDLGFCGIQTGNVMGFAAELYQRGILTKEDLGFELKWGDAKAFARLAEMIAKREGIGDVLAEGSYRAALKISKLKGVDVTKYVVHEKGEAIGAHGIRSGLDYPPVIAYACSVQGGDHTSVAGLPPEKSPSELMWGFLDSGVICGFNVTEEQYDLVWEMLRAVTGWNITMDEWNTSLGPRMLTIQRTMLLLGGPDLFWDPAKDDDNPPRFYEPLPSGPQAGRAANRDEVMAEKKKYYESLGWDELGIPKSETLKKLGLEKLESAVERVRSRLSS